MRKTLIALSCRNAATRGTLLFAEHRLVYLWNKQPFHSPSLGVICCQLLKPCREHRSIAAVAAERIRLSPELQFSIAAKADGEIMLFSIDPIRVAIPMSHVRAVPGCSALPEAPFQHCLRAGSLLGLPGSQNAQVWAFVASSARGCEQSFAGVCTTRSLTESRAECCRWLCRHSGFASPRIWLSPCVF